MSPVRFLVTPLSERHRNVAQLVAHYVRDVGVGRSSRLIPTLKSTSRWIPVAFFVLIPLKRPRNARTGFLPSHHRQPTPLLLSASLSIPAKNTTEKASYTGPGKDKQRKTGLFMQEIEHICRKIQKILDKVYYVLYSIRRSEVLMWMFR